MLKKVKETLKKQGYYIVLCAVLALIVTSGYLSRQEAVPQKAQAPLPSASPPSYSWESAATLPEPTDEPVVETIVRHVQEEPAEPEPEPTVEPEPTAQAVQPLPAPPLSGATLAAFSDSLAYCEAMDDWRTHNGMDIAAEAGSGVCAALAGSVTAVYEDGSFGNTVVLTHQDGTQTFYSFIKPAVTVGQKVEQSEFLGAVEAPAASEGAMESHLHFAVKQNGVSVDPAVWLGE